MSKLGEIKARRLLRVLARAGFREIRSRGSHRFLEHPDGRRAVFGFHIGSTIGPRALAQFLREAGISVEQFLHLR